jgi:electron transfer flavoprotein alpha subunit
MANDVLVVVEQLEGKVSEITFELLGKGRELAGALGGNLCALLVGSGVKDLAGELGAADTLLVADHPDLAHYVPDAFKQTLVEVVKTHCPRLVLTSGTALGMDQAAGLSAELGLPLVAYATDLRFDGNSLAIVSQLYGGKIFSESLVDAAQAVVSVMAGAFSADAGKASGSPSIEEIAPVTLSSRFKFKRLIQPEAGDIDITKQAILVSVGRGIQSKENIPVVQELADALDAALSASRPVVDNGWLPKTRQVGKSGLTVKPKLYIAIGISGAPEHIEGMKDAELILAINSDQAAPIFNVAHYGVVSDLFDVIPLLTERIRAGS